MKAQNMAYRHSKVLPGLFAAMIATSLPSIAKAEPEQQSQIDQVEAPVQAEDVFQPNPPVTPPNEDLPIIDSQSAVRTAEEISEKLMKSVRNASPISPENLEQRTALAQTEMNDAHADIVRPQIVVIVDRNPHVQKLSLVLALPESKNWIGIGQVPVSTGATGRKFHYITPTGVFPNDISRLGYRALGTFNENHIRGIGLKGLRVWDFGWHDAQKGWSGNGKYGFIRLEMHATDPANLEYRLGRPDSDGCIRIPTAFNRFMDHNGLIDASYEAESKTSPTINAILAKDREPTPIAGDYVVVIDSRKNQNAR